MPMRVLRLLRLGTSGGVPLLGMMVFLERGVLGG